MKQRYSSKAMFAFFFFFLFLFEDQEFILGQLVTGLTRHFTKVVDSTAKLPDKNLICWSNLTANFSFLIELKEEK